MPASHSSPSSDSTGRDSPTNPNQPLQHSRSISPSSTVQRMEHRDEKKISDTHLANQIPPTDAGKSKVKGKGLPAEHLDENSGESSSSSTTRTGRAKGRAREGKGKAKGKGGDDSGSKRQQQQQQQQRRQLHPPQAQHQPQQNQLQTRGFQVRM